MVLRISIIGSEGRMGQLVAKQVVKDPNLSLTAGLMPQGHPSVGKRVIESDPALVHDLPEFAFNEADVVIDFSHSTATDDTLKAVELFKTPLVLGTTGLTPKQHEQIEKVSRSAPILVATNTSYSICVMKDLIETAAHALGEEYDIEIHETHHRNKVDAPSGTAFSLGRHAAKGRGISFEEAVLHDKNNARETGKIGFSSSRGGDIVGTHTISFYGPGETLEIKSQITDRAVFAKGALKAASWLALQKPGLYDMSDLFKESTDDLAKEAI